MIQNHLLFSAVIDLQTRGYHEDFQILNGGILWVQQKLLFNFPDFSLVEFCVLKPKTRSKENIIVLGVILCSSIKGIIIQRQFIEQHPEINIDHFNLNNLHLNLKIKKK